MPKLPARIAAFAWLALLGLCLAWELWLAPLRSGGSWLWLKALPIALTLPGLLRGNPASLQLALLTSTLYLMEAAVRMFEPWPVRGLAWAELVLVCVFFCAAVAALRPLKRAAKARASLARATQASEGTR